MRYFVRLVGAIGCTLGLWAAASAVHAGPREDCEQSGNIELSIRACGDIIRRDRAAWAYISRGAAYADKGDYDRMVADFNEAIRLSDEAIRLNPRNARAYADRGRGYASKGETDRAIADYSEAIRLKPNDASYYLWRAGGYTSKNDYERAIADCNEAIRLNPNDGGAYSVRALAYWRKGDHQRAIADYGEHIRRSPRNSVIYINRGTTYTESGDHDRAIADFSEAIRLDPSSSNAKAAYQRRSLAYSAKGDYDRALADYNEAMRRFPDFLTLEGRGTLYYAKGDYDRAIADFSEHLRRYPTSSSTYSHRGNTYRKKGDYQRAIADHNEAIRLNRDGAIEHADRGETYESMGDRAKAIEDYRRALTLRFWYEEGSKRQAEVTKRLAELQRTPPATAPAAVAPPPASAPTAVPAPPIATVPTPPIVVPPPAPVAEATPPNTPSTPPGRRVALVMGNAAYRTVKALPNPRNDASALAAELRAAGFTDVMEKYDLGVLDMRRVLSDFEDKATGADWAVVYYAGHGIEVDGRNYLVPIDAVLKRSSDLEDETLPLDRVLARVAVAHKLQLVILDACRDNPFASRLAQPGAIKRTIGTRGLARVEPAHPNLMIAYSARQGEAALDGPPGSNSPYARALVKHLAAPGLELGIFFRRVRADVLEATKGQQRPFEDSSLTDEGLFFRPAPK